MTSGLTDTATAAARTAGVGLAAEVGPVAKDTEFDDVAGIADIGTAEMAADIRPADEAAGNIPEAAEDYHIVVAVEVLQTIIETADVIAAAKAAADVVATAKSSENMAAAEAAADVAQIGPGDIVATAESADVAVAAA